MNRFALFPVAIVLAAAYAFADSPTAPPKMTFRVLQGDTHLSAFEHDVMPYRSRDVVIVVSKTQFVAVKSRSILRSRLRQVKSPCTSI